MFVLCFETSRSCDAWSKRTKRRSELCTTAGFARCIRSSCIFSGDPDEAEDVVEETFWQAWRKAGSYEPSRGAVSTWLLTIDGRKALDRLRAKSAAVKT